MHVLNRAFCMVHVLNALFISYIHFAVNLQTEITALRLQHGMTTLTMSCINATSYIHGVGETLGKPEGDSINRGRSMLRLFSPAHVRLRTSNRP